MAEDAETQDSEKDDSTKLTIEEALAQVFVFYVAGFETSSTAMQWALYELALNPQLQEKAREEINRVLAKHDGKLTYEVIYEMDYVGRIIDGKTLIFMSFINFEKRRRFMSSIFSGIILCKKEIRLTKI